MSEPIAKVQASAPGRLFALGVMFALGALLSYLAAVTPEIGTRRRLISAVCGAGALYLGENQRKAT